MNLEYFVFVFCLIPSTICGYTNLEVTIINRNKHLIKNVMNQPLNLEEIIVSSLELAVDECKKLFMWDRWNCPTNDFMSKRKSQNYDREVSFVRALSTAAFIYTTTKRCSEMTIPNCGCIDDECSDNPEFAEKLLRDIYNDLEQYSSDAQGYAMVHNSRAGRIAIRNSLQVQCRCENLQVNCKVPKCRTILKNFSEIASEVRQMYDRALVLKVHNSGVSDWSNIPKNTLVFVTDSPNYCLPGSIPGWKGMEDRQCFRSKDKERSVRERRSCKHLCKECGFRVRTRTVTKREKCNCTFVWCCEVKCDTCEFIEREYYCE